MGTSTRYLIIVLSLLLASCMNNDGEGLKAKSDILNQDVTSDIAAYIDSLNLTVDQRSAAMQAFLAMEAVLSVNVKDLEAVRKVNLALAQADHCLYLLFEPGLDKINAAQVSHTLEQMAISTPERQQRYAAFNRAMSGATWALPSNSICE